MNHASWPSPLMRNCISGFLFGASLLSTNVAALAQEAGLTGQDKAADVVQARQLLMDTVEENMMVIDSVVAGKDAPLGDLKARAYLINTLATAFPHLFPPQTKPPSGPEDPGFQTNATLVLWQEFPAFYQSVQDFAAIALDASQTSDMTKFRDYGRQLTRLIHEGFWFEARFRSIAVTRASLFGCSPPDVPY